MNNLYVEPLVGLLTNKSAVVSCVVVLRLQKLVTVQPMCDKSV